MTAPSESLLSIQGLSKSFAGTKVLTDIDLEVPRGTVVARLGASGSGKTTLLQLIAGLVEPDSGSLVIDGRDMRDVPAHARPVNMVFQSYALFPHLSVAGNIAYGLSARGTPRAERTRLVDWALELCRLEGLGKRKPDQLSGGQRQRVALARCLVLNPAILLLDEPMAALDRSLRADVQRELLGIQRKLGATFILVTHDQDEAMALSDYVAVMDRGRIVQFGPPAIVYEYPRTRFVASFLGTMNVFEGTVGPDARLGLEDGMSVRLSSAGRPALAAGSALGVRPEKLVVSRDATGLDNDFTGTIEQLTYAGNHSQARIRVGAKRLLEATIVNREHGGRAALILGETVHVGFRTEALVELRD